MQQTLTSHTKSSLLYSKACEIIPGGVNSPVRSFHSVGMDEPVFISKAKGPYVWDEDNNQYIDYVCSWGALIHGHIHPKVVTAIKEALEKGISYGACHEKEIELAEIITSNIPSVEKVRLVNSGTEAVMTAIRLGRAYTKRNKIIKFEGCYHGHSDSVLSKSGSGIATMGIPGSLGVTKACASDTITIPYNDISTLEITLSKYPKEIACVLVEPVIGNAGVILPKENFLQSIRQLTKKFGVLLIFDEVITGFRLSKGGAQQKFNIMPDITTLGKIIGGGMPIGAVGGKKEIMALLAPLGGVYQAGTLSGNPISVSCGIATLNLLSNESYEYLEELTNKLCLGINEIFSDLKTNIQINQAGSMFSIFFSDNKIFDFKSSKKSNAARFITFFQNLLKNGIYIAPSPYEANFISLAHTEEDIKKTLSSIKKSV